MTLTKITEVQASDDITLNKSSNSIIPYISADFLTVYFQGGTAHKKHGKYNYVILLFQY